MSANTWLGAMVAASVLVVATSRRPEPAPEPPVPRAPPEAPWLTPDAAAQIVGPDGRLGPLFAGVELGGPAPPSAVRARIANFASTNNVRIDLEIADGTVTAVRFDVTFAGCCGYEGADVLALRFCRPRTGGGCMGGEMGWRDDWSIANEDGVYVRARVRVNRLAVRWERQLALDELLERADRLLGADVVTVAREAGDRWHDLEPSRRYLLDVPYSVNTMAQPWDNLGIEIVVGSGRIVELSFLVRDDDGTSTRLMRSRWGRPRIADEKWTWRRADRVVVADRDSWTPRVTIRMR